MSYLEKGTATHSSVLAWRIPLTEEPGKLQSMGPQRVGHNWVTFTLGFPGSSAGKELTYNAGDPSLIPGSGRSPGERIGYPLQYSWTPLVAQTPPAMQKTQVWILGQEDPLEKEMATHSSILAWRIPWTEEPGRLQSSGPKRVRHNWATNTFTLS